jgi:hypothetical protein
MLAIPLHGSSNGSIIPIVNRLSGLSGHMCLQMELVEEDVEALLVALRQPNQSII